MSVAVAAIREKLAADAIKTLEKVYAAIELKRVCEMCHANEEDVVRRIQSKGWAVDNGMVIVSQVPHIAP